MELLCPGPLTAWSAGPHVFLPPHIIAVGCGGHGTSPCRARRESRHQRHCIRTPRQPPAAHAAAQPPHHPNRSAPGSSPPRLEQPAVPRGVRCCILIRLFNGNWVLLILPTSRLDGSSAASSAPSPADMPASVAATPGAPLAIIPPCAPATPAAGSPTTISGQQPAGGGCAFLNTTPVCTQRLAAPSTSHVRRSGPQSGKVPRLPITCLVLPHQLTAYMAIQFGPFISQGFQTHAAQIILTTACASAPPLIGIRSISLNLTTIFPVHERSPPYPPSPTLPPYQLVPVSQPPSPAAPPVPDAAFAAATASAPPPPLPPTAPTSARAARRAARLAASGGAVGGSPNALSPEGHGKQSLPTPLSLPRTQGTSLVAAPPPVAVPAAATSPPLSDVVLVPQQPQQQQ